jgi:hypothetical protein
MEAYTSILLKPDLQRRFQSRPENLIELVRANKSSNTFIIDEIQKVPELLSAVYSNQGDIAVKNVRSWKMRSVWEE